MVMTDFGHDWKSQTHYRLYLMGFNGKQRQQFIDHCVARFLDPVEFGMAIVSQNKIKVDTLKVQVPWSSVWEHIWYEYIWYVTVEPWRWVKGWLDWWAFGLGASAVRLMPEKIRYRLGCYCGHTKPYGWVVMAGCPYHD